MIQTLNEERRSASDTLAQLAPSESGEPRVSETKRDEEIAPAREVVGHHRAAERDEEGPLTRRREPTEESSIVASPSGGVPVGANGRSNRYNILRLSEQLQIFFDEFGTTVQVGQTARSCRR